MGIRYKGPPSADGAPPPDSAPEDMHDIVEILDQQHIKVPGLNAPANETVSAGESPESPRIGFAGVLLAVLSAAGLAASIALLYQGTGTIMATQGGFVATGGPYVIANQAPPWVWIVPASIFGIFIFGGIGLYASNRGWGINPAVFAWSALFIALGWNFLRLGFNPPPNLQGAWAWIMCGIIFWIMGFAPLLLFISAFGRAWAAVVARQNSDARRVWTPPSRRDTTGAYLAVQFVGALLGVWAGVMLFGVIAG
jgi:hypothetical protein